MSITRRDFIARGLAAGGGALLQVCACSATQNADSSQPGKARAQSNPSYLELERDGTFQERIDQAYSMMENCELCPHRCGVNRRRGQRGLCEATDAVTVHSHNPHFGEEIPLVGRRGSGTIFFSHCNLRCVFCQNWPIAHEGRGRRISDEQLAGRMLDLQRMGCHNINVVTPTHYMPNILNATRLAMKQGLRLPLCYNTGGYERAEVIQLLDGMVDLYLPDMKFMDGAHAKEFAFTHAADYPEQAKPAIAEMHRQVGDLRTDADGIALSGLMIRHLVMPNEVAGTREFVHWVAQNLSTSTYVNIMAQYRVEHQAFDHPLISRAITPAEFVQAMDWAREAGLSNLDQRSASQANVFRRRM